MNIKPTAAREAKLRTLDQAKLKRVNYQNDKRREMQGKTKISLHEHYNTDALPDAADLKAWVDEFHRENGIEPNTLKWPYFTKSKSVIVFSNSLQKCVTLKIDKSSEFVGLDYRTTD